MKKYIIFISCDVRESEKQAIYQVAKTSRHHYKVGDYLTVDIKEHYETKKGKLHQLVKESVLLKVWKVFANVVYCNIVEE